MSPAVIFSLEFLTPNNPEWYIGTNDLYDYYGRTGKYKRNNRISRKNIDDKDYYNYMSRNNIPESVDDYSKNFVEYLLPENESSGIFDEQKDLLDLHDIEYYRQLETISKYDNCPKYTAVISFDTDFLKEYNIITKNNLLNVGRLRELTRAGMTELISSSHKLENDNVYWTGGIHMDKAHIHIHVSLLEYERREQREKIYRDKDMLENHAFDKLKSKIVNQIIGPERIIAISKMERDVIPPQISANYMSCTEQLTALALKLPPPNSKGEWEYGRLRTYHDDIDKTVYAVITSDPRLCEQYDKYIKMLDDHTNLLKRIYGPGERHLYQNFKKNRLKDFHTRTGNALLKYMPELRNVAMHSSYDNFAHLSEENFSPVYIDEYSRRVDKFIPEEDSSDQLLMDEQNEYPISEDTISFMETEQFLNNEDLPDADGVKINFHEQPAHPSEKKKGPYIEWTEQYNNALSLIYSKNPNFEKAKDILLSERKKGNILATYDLGKLYEKKMINIPNSEKIAQDYYSQTFDGFNYILSNDTAIKALKLSERDRKHIEWETAYMHYRIGKLYNRGQGTEQDIVAAKKHYLEANGNKYAEFALGNIYKYGNGTDINYAEALRHYKKSANQGMPFADYALGTAYENGQGTNVDEVQSQQHYANALDGFLRIYKKSPDDTIAYKIGLMYYKGKGTEVDYSTAEEYLNLSVKANNSNAQYMLGKLYLDEGRIDEALEVLTIASEKNNNAFSQYALGRLYLKEYGDYNKAEAYFLKSAEQNNEFAQYALGKLYLNEEHQDFTKAEQFFAKAADEHNNQFAQYALGRLYLKEYGDYNKAEAYFLKSAEQDNEFAEYQLGKMYSSPDKEQPGAAIQYYTMAADNHGNQYAQYQLGKIYMSDEHQNYHAAEQYLTASEAQGNEASCYLLGKLYLKEEYQNFAKAEQFLSRAADKYNNQYAQYTLGKFYLSEGHYNRELAEDYLLKSSLQNNSAAQLRLGLMYMKENNSEAASYWIRAAAEQGNEIAKDILSHPPKKEIKVSPKYRTAKCNLARSTYSALRKIYSEMDRHIRELLSEAEREEERERIKNRRY